MKKDFREIYETLSAIDVSKHIKQLENGHSYLPWSPAWHIVLEYFPDAEVHFHENEDGIPVFVSDYGAWCRVSVTIGENTRTMDLPVLNHSQKPMKDKPYSFVTKKGKVIKVDSLNSFDINTTKMRCWVKCLSLFGLAKDLYEADSVKTLDDKEDWSANRLKKIGGSGTHKDETWAEIDVGFLTWCLENNKFLAVKAQNEIDYRADNFENNDGSEIGAMKADARDDAIEILTKKYSVDIMSEKYLALIDNAGTEDELKLIVNKIKLTDIVASSVKKKLIDIDEYKEKVLATFNGKDDDISNIFQEMQSIIDENGGEENDERLKYYQDLIEKQWKRLGYQDNPSLSINSSKKHLGTEDIYTIKNWHKLKTYYEYLSDKERKNGIETPNDKESYGPVIGE